MTLHLSFPSSTLGKLKKARGALEPLLQLLEFSVCAACLCTVCMCVRYVCQAVLICMVLLARRASPNGQKTKERDRMATHTVQPGCWAHFTPPSPWKPSTGSAWRTTTNLTVEERVRLHPGRRVGRQKEPLSLLILQQKKQEKKASHSISAADSSLSHGSSVKVQLKQAWIVRIRRLFVSLCVCF